MACTADNALYHHYETVADEGWDKEDTLLFSTDTLRETASCSLEVEMRTTMDYPYRSLSMMVEETAVPTGEKRVYSVTLQIATDEGERNGEHISICTLGEVLPGEHKVMKGNVVNYKIYHKMRRQVLPGIKDVGVKLTKN